MPNQEPMRDPRLDRQEDEGPVVVGASSEEPPPENLLPAIEELHRELAKTGVISDAFKDYILRMALTAAEEAVGSMAPNGVEQEALRQEFLSRRFEDKSCVKLGSRTIEELLSECVKKPFFGRMIGEYFDTHFPEPLDAMRLLLLGSYEEAVSVREWLWREINENPVLFCELEKRLSEDA